MGTTNGSPAVIDVIEDTQHKWLAIDRRSCRAIAKFVHKEHAEAFAATLQPPAIFDTLKPPATPKPRKVNSLTKDCRDSEWTYTNSGGTHRWRYDHDNHYWQYSADGKTWRNSRYAEPSNIFCPYVEVLKKEPRVVVGLENCDKTAVWLRAGTGSHYRYNWKGHWEFSYGTHYWTPFHESGKSGKFTEMLETKEPRVVKELTDDCKDAEWILESTGSRYRHNGYGWEFYNLANHGDKWIYRDLSPLPGYKYTEVLGGGE